MSIFSYNVFYIYGQSVVLYMTKIHCSKYRLLNLFIGKNAKRHQEPRQDPTYAKQPSCDKGVLEWQGGEYAIVR